MFDKNEKTLDWTGSKFNAIGANASASGGAETQMKKKNTIKLSCDNEIYNLGLTHTNNKYLSYNHCIQ